MDSCAKQSTKREVRGVHSERWLTRGYVVLTALLAIALAIGAGAKPAAAAFPGSNGEIAFQSNRDHFNNSALFEIYVMNADGGDQTRLTFSGGAMPSWSPDGRKIVFSRNVGNGGEIWVMNADGSDQTQLTFTPVADDISPTWSSDGSKIAFARFSGGNYDIWVMNADGSNPTDITNNPAEDIEPSWQPGGSKIAFRSSRSGSPQIYVMNADGSGVTNLSNSPTSFEEDPDWSPDGSKIAFDSNRATPGFGVDIYVMNADGSNVTRLTTTGQEEMPAWSPNGTKIVFRSSRDFNDEIYVMNADGTGATRLTNNAPPGSTLPEDWFPSWQPIITADTTPPVITVPEPITVNAASPIGAVVTYSVTATDPDDAVASLACLPASGSTFPIGTTTVTCTATDTHGNTSSASFTVTVKGAVAQLTDLLAAVTGVGPGTSLADKITLVQSDLVANDLADACSTLTALINEVSAQSGKTIPSSQAATLIASVQQIRALLGC
jgi:HYR domain/WD40-like Beta Propeller Repeat